MAISREEQLRNSRRVARQLVGAVVVVLVLIGLVTVLGWAMKGLRSALDDSDRKAGYADRLYGLVMFDTLPFDDAAAVDPNVFKQAAIWGTVYQIQKNGGTLDTYERDEATGCVILPKLEVDTYISNLLGPDYPITDGAFETTEMNYQYSEEKQGYLVPITGSVGLFTPTVEKIATKNGKTIVTVGYVPTLNGSSSLTLAAPTEPTKYMDYVFTRGANRHWYLTALQDSEMVAPASSAASSTSGDSTAAAASDPQAMVESNLSSSLADSAASSDANAQPASDSEAPADSGPQSDAASDSAADAASDSASSEDTASSADSASSPAA